VSLQGLNEAAEGGILSVDVVPTDPNDPPGFAPGSYRLCSINAAANHQPVIVPIAQHGSLDDCVYVSLPRTSFNLHDLTFFIVVHCG
jgi:hypothetical protein